MNSKTGDIMISSKSVIKAGDIIRLDSDNVRDWVAIPYLAKIARKKTFNHTGFLLCGGLWYDGDALTAKPYGKCYGELEVGHFNHATIVGNITNKEDYERYKKTERL